MNHNLFSYFLPANMREIKKMRAVVNEVNCADCKGMN